MYDTYLILVRNPHNQLFAYGPFDGPMAANAWAKREENLGHIRSGWDIVPYLPIPVYPKLRMVKS